MPSKAAKSGCAPAAGNGRAGGGREHIAGPVGERLREHRQEAGMSLRALARDVGVSPSLISQIEHGKATPSVGTLYAIVSELGISFDELFFDGPRGAAASADQEPERHADSGDERTPSSHWQAPSEGPVLRSGNRLTLTLATGVRWERLTARTTPASSSSTAPTRSAASPARPTSLMTHSGSEYGIVLSGRLGATVGEDSYELESGDSIAFESTRPHRIWAIGDEAAVAIWTVVGREGDPRVGG